MAMDMKKIWGLLGIGAAAGLIAPFVSGLLGVFNLGFLNTTLYQGLTVGGVVATALTVWLSAWIIEKILKRDVV